MGAIGSGSQFLPRDARKGRTNNEPDTECGDKSDKSPHSKSARNPHPIFQKELPGISRIPHSINNSQVCSLATSIFPSSLVSVHELLP